MTTAKNTREYELNERANDMMSNAYWDGYEDASGDTNVKRFRRNKIDGILGGVCAGIGDYTGIDHIIVRIIFLALVVFTGFPLFVYFLLWIFIPSDKRAPYRREVREAIRAERKYERSTSRHAERAADIARRHAPTTTLSDVRSKYRSIETRMQDLEKSITSKEWQLRRDFKDLED